MNTDFEKLARRAVACKRWRWLPSMMLCLPPRYEEKEPWRDRIPDWFCVSDGLKGAYPDLSDPATLGCLVALVREVTGKPHLFCSYRQEGFWGVADHDEFLSDFYTTEAEAWLEVLEAAE